MAATQKKTTAKKKTSRKTPPPAPACNPTARLIGGVVCLLLALCLIVSMFSSEAVLLRLMSDGIKGLLGGGYYACGPALLLAGLMLIFHREKPGKLRVVTALLLPLLCGMAAHLIRCREPYGFGLPVIRELWSDGKLLLCGGVLAGYLGSAAHALLGKAVSLILLTIWLIASVFILLRKTPGQLLEKIRQRREEARRWDEENEETETQVVQDKVPKAARQTRARTRADIDIPLDGEEPPVDKGEAVSFFRGRDRSVRTPAEVLNPRRSEETEEIPTAPAAAAAAGEAPAVEKPRSRARKIQAVSDEVESATQEVTQEIEKELSEEEGAYRYPPITLLLQNTGNNDVQVGSELRSNSQRLGDALASFGVDATPGEVIHGPSVTRYEFTLDQGVKLSKITNLSDDIALSLGASGVRIAPIPGKVSVVGIEVPNRVVTSVCIREVIESRAFTEHKSNTAFAIGKDIGGSCVIGNISKLPHVLIAGTTGSGKSVCTNSLIVSMLYKSTPDEVRFIMVDPKMVELAPYNGIPHLLIPVVTDPKKAAGALQWAVYEMMKRYKIFSEKGVKDLAGYNALCDNPMTAEEGMKKMPAVVVVIDELADLMLVAAKEVEESICRVAQMGRAAGVHLVIATQRPSADVITGLMKANIPSRIAFAVASSMESRIILDTTGAEKLVGKGDMLYFPLGDSKPTRVQGCFISPEEIEKVVAFVKESGEVQYDQTVMDKIEEALRKEDKSAAGNANSGETGNRDEMFDSAVEVVLETQQASVSMLQRRLKLGYSRAARLVDQMEEYGIVGPFEGSKPRQLLITRQQWQEMQMKNSPAAEAPAEVPKPDRFGSIRDVFESRDALE